MASAEFVSPKGTIENLMVSGFSTANYLSEFIDNSMHRVKAAATTIRFKLQADNTLIAVDDGIGMTCDLLTGSRTLNQRSDATDEGQGCRGIGMKAAEVGLTEAVEPVVVLSKTTDGPINSIITNYAEIIRTDKAPNFLAQEASRRHEDLFIRHAINQEHGTMLILKLTPRKYAEVADLLVTTDQLKNLLIQLGITYYTRLNQGFLIQFQQPDETLLTVAPIDPLSWTRNLDTNRERMQERHVEVWENPVTNAVQTFFESDKGMVYVTGERPIKEIPDAYPPAGFLKVGTFMMRSVFTDEWEALQGDIFDYKDQKGKLHEGLSGLRFLRNDKFIHYIPIPKPTTGDHMMRKYVTDSRYSISFSTVLDKYFDIQINKSKADNIHWNVLKTVRYLAKSFSDGQYSVFKADKEVALTAEIRRKEAERKAQEEQEQKEQNEREEREKERRAIKAAKLKAQREEEERLRKIKEAEESDRRRQQAEEDARKEAEEVERRRQEAEQAAAKKAAEEQHLLTIGYNVANVDNRVVLHISNQGTLKGTRVLDAPISMVEGIHHMLLRCSDAAAATKLMDAICKCIGVK
jgi:hypothetical protein